MVVVANVRRLAIMRFQAMPFLMGYSGTCTLTHARKVGHDLYEHLAQMGSGCPDMTTTEYK